MANSVVLSAGADGAATPSATTRAGPTGTRPTTSAYGVDSRSRSSTRCAHAASGPPAHGCLQRRARAARPDGGRGRRGARRGGRCPSPRSSVGRVRAQLVEQVGQLPALALRRTSGEEELIRRRLPRRTRPRPSARALSRPNDRVASESPPVRPKENRGPPPRRRRPARTPPCAARHRRAAGHVHPRRPGQQPVRRDDRRQRLGDRRDHRPRASCPAFADGATTAAALALAAAAIIGVALLKIVGILGRRLFAGIMSYRLQADYRRRVTRQYLRLPLSWHQRHPTGQLLSNANSDVEASWFFVAPAAVRLRRAGHDRDHRRGAVPHRPADRARRPRRLPGWSSRSTSSTRR